MEVGQPWRGGWTVQDRILDHPRTGGMLVVGLGEGLGQNYKKVLPVVTTKWKKIILVSLEEE
jgi:hypothetical protein